MRKTIVAIGSILFVLMAAPGVAHDQGYTQLGGYYDGWPWRDYHAVGSSCGGEVNSRYVKSLKAILWADGDIQDMVWIDQTFNSTTHNNLKQYQGKHALSQDGCAGFNTWGNMQNDSHYDSRLGVRYHHLTADGGYTAAGTYYQWREQGGNRHVRYLKWSPNGEGIGGYSGCWQLVNAKNDAYTNFESYNVFIEHNMNETCD